MAIATSNALLISADSHVAEDPGVLAGLGGPGAATAGGPDAVTLPAQAVVRPASEASVAPAPPAGTHHVRSPTMPSAVTPRSAW